MKRTAGLQISVYPAGTPGQVLVEVVNTGPERLSRREITILLRQALESAERELEDGDA